MHELFRRAKRAGDVVLATILTVLTAPLLVLAVVLVRLTSDGPAIYSQTRVGEGRRQFRMFKVRSMYHDCERHSGPRWSTDNDPRVTPVGRFLRKTHLDELPQLWNVLRGEMSLVGPRPERPEFVTQLEKSIPRYADRLLMPPGVTGLAQVNLPPDTDHDSVRAKLAFDLYYVENACLWLDVRLMLSTGLFMLGLPFEVSSRLLGLQPAPLVERYVRPRPVEVPADRELASTALSAWPEG